MTEDTGPRTVPDLLKTSGGRTGRRVAARQAVVEGRRHRLRRGLAALLTLVLAFSAALAAYYVGLFFYLDRSIERVDALDTDSAAIIAADAQAADDNYLIVGTEGVGTQERVTSALMAHIAEGGERAVLVSLPLTAFVDVPACAPESDPAARPADPYGGSLGSAFDSGGGAACLVRTVQQLSGVLINHYVEIDLERLPGMVSALDGVDVCLPESLVVDGELTVPAGGSLITGSQVRTLLDDDTELEDPTGQQVNDRQRLLLTATVREALRLGNLANPGVISQFVSEAANGLTLDPTTTLGELKDLGDKLAEFTSQDTSQTAVPLTEVNYVPEGTDDSYALIDELASRQMFQAIIANMELPPPPGSPQPEGEAGETGAPTPTGEPAPTAQPAPSEDPAPSAESTAQTTPVPTYNPAALTVPPSEITLNVFNGVGTVGLASGAADQLTAQGFSVDRIENQITGDTQSVVRYPPELVEAARTVAAAVPGSVLAPGPAGTAIIDLVVGSSFEAVVPVTVPPLTAGPPAPGPTEPIEPPASTEPTAPTTVVAQARPEACMP